MNKAVISREGVGRARALHQASAAAIKALQTKAVGISKDPIRPGHVAHKSLALRSLEQRDGSLPYESLSEVLFPPTPIQMDSKSFHLNFKIRQNG